MLAVTTSHACLRYPAYSFPSTGAVTSIIVQEQCPISLSDHVSASPRITPLTAASLSSSGGWQAAAVAKGSRFASGNLPCSLRKSMPNENKQHDTSEDDVENDRSSAVPEPERGLKLRSRADDCSTKKIDSGNDQWRTVEATRRGTL
jgi:hypothetical protein